MNIVGIEKRELLKLKASYIDHPLSIKEFMYIAETFDALWKYDYDAAENGKVGMHAELKSGLHSDMFFVSKILLEPDSIMQIISEQIVMKFRKLLCEPDIFMPDYIVGVPNGATKLGENISKILNIQTIEMKKIDGRILLVTPIKARKIVLIIEDFCTKGTGFTEAVGTIMKAQPKAIISHCDPVILNRGGLKNIFIGKKSFKILPVIEYPVNEWEPKDCPLCKLGSIPIKPKETNENWEAITTSQLYE